MPVAKYTNDVQPTHGGDTFIEGKRGHPSHSPGCRDSIGGMDVVSRIGERKSGRMGDVDLDFDHGVGMGAWATASPRSTDTSNSPSNTPRLIGSTGRLSISVSSPSSGGGGGGGFNGNKLCVAPADWTNRKNAVVSLLDYVYTCW